MTPLPLDDSVNTDPQDSPEAHAANEALAKPLAHRHAPAPGNTEGPAAYSLVARGAAELFGAFLITFGVMFTLAFSAMQQEGSVLIVALSTGFMFIAATATVAQVSGGHFFAAVTVAQGLLGRTRWADAGVYLGCQLLGSIGAAALTFALIPQGFPPLLYLANRGELIAQGAPGYGQRSPLYVASQGGAQFDMVHALVITVVASAIFVAVIVGARGRRATDSGHKCRSRWVMRQALVGGLALVALHLLTRPVTNGGFDIGRALGSSIFAGEGLLWQQLWVFVLAPLVGGVLAATFIKATEPSEADLPLLTA